jgi:ribosome-binding protein aMBF1 (putative translation factor)
MQEDDRHVRLAAKRMRDHLGFSRGQLAEKLGVSERLINYLENGERVWSDKLLEKLLSHLQSL